MKNFKTNLLKGALLLGAILVFSTGTQVEAKAKPKLSNKKITITVGQKKKLKVKNFKKKKKIKWSSKNSKIATVNKKGKVVGKKKGKTTIIAKAGKKKLKCKVVVKKAKKSSNKKTDTNKKIKLNKQVKKELYPDNVYISFNASQDMGLGQNLDLFKFMLVGGKIMDTPSDAIKTNYYKWFSSDSSVVSINKYGVATAHKTGKANVYCKYVNKSGKWTETRTCTIKVENYGNVSFSFAFGTDSNALNYRPTYPSDITGSYYPNPNYVNVTVTNNSDVEITVYKSVGLYTWGWSYWYTQNKQSVVIPAKTTMTIKYLILDNEGALGDPDFDQISLIYDIDGKQVCPTYDFTNNYWKYD